MTKIIALTGPPAAGKSTVCELFGDLGVPSVSTGDGVREEAHQRYDDPTEDDIWATAESLREELGEAGATIACRDLIDDYASGHEIVAVSDLRHQAEVRWLDEHYESVLVVRVDTRNATERTRRYVQREVDMVESDEPVPAERERELRQEIRDRELRESPYPRHHLTLLNDDSRRIDEILYQLEGVCEFVDPDGTYESGVTDV